MPSLAHLQNSEQKHTHALGLYVHVPFCIHKCSYCDFNSWREESSSAYQNFLETLVEEIESWVEYWRKEEIRFEVDTIFLGGGTPSLLSYEQMDKLGRCLKSLPLTQDVEISMEANPETISIEKLSSMAHMGVNRLSMGVQSFNQASLDRLERLCSPEKNREALSLIDEFWCGRWSFDLMFALPEQSLEDWKRDLKEAISYSPEHISAYELTLTTQKAKTWKRAPQDELLEYYQYTEKYLAENELDKYEISNFCKAGKESRHNLKYWELKPFLGVGPGAYSLLNSDLLSGENDRKKIAFGGHRKNPGPLQNWIQSVKLKRHLEKNTWELRSTKDHLCEKFSQGFRLRSGINSQEFGLGNEMASDFLNPFVKDGLLFLEDEDKRWKMTLRGEEILDHVLTKIFERIDAWDPNLTQFSTAQMREHF